MIRRPPRSTRTDTLFPYTTLFRADPNRTAFIALVKYADDELAYIIAPQRLAVGDKVVAGKKNDVKPGNAMELGQMPIGTIVHNVEMKPSSEESRVGQECVRTCRSRWATAH